MNVVRYLGVIWIGVRLTKVALSKSLGISLPSDFIFQFVENCLIILKLQFWVIWVEIGVDWV